MLVSRLLMSKTGAGEAACWREAGREKTPPDLWLPGLPGAVRAVEVRRPGDALGLTLARRVDTTGRGLNTSVGLEARLVAAEGLEPLENLGLSLLSLGSTRTAGTWSRMRGAMMDSFP